MKLHNPFDSDHFWPGYCAILSIVFIAVTLCVIQPLVLLALPFIPIYFAGKYLLTGK